MKFEKGSGEWNMFRDYWKLCQKFWIPEDNDKYWKDVIRETDDFYKKYKNIGLGKGISIAFIDTLDKQCRKKKR